MFKYLVTGILFLQIKSSLVQGNESDLKPKWEVWENVPSTSQFKIYLFNVTNPDEFEYEGKSPIFNEVGPYIFNEKRQKISIEVSDDKTSVKFREVKYYEFVSSDSVGSEEDLVSIINLPLLSFGKILGEIPFVGANFFKSLIKNGERLVRRNEKVGDIFYFGFNARPYIKLFEELQPDQPIPDEFSGGRFGLFKGRNGTDEGEFSVGTGSSPSKPFGSVLSWNNRTQLLWWDSEACNSINGTLIGDGFDPRTLSKYHFSVFYPDACRSLLYSYHGSSLKYHSSSIRSWKYAFAQEMIEESSMEKSSCYCLKEDKKECYEKGVFDLGPCKNSAPLVLSYPHFLHASKKYTEKINGMNANSSLHNSHMLIEPKTGTVLQDIKRFQLNIHMNPIPSLAYLKNVTDLLLPLFWSEKIYSITDEAVEILKEELKQHPDDETIDDEGSWNVNGNLKGAHGGYTPNPNSAGFFNFSYSFSTCIIFIFMLILT